MWEKLKKDFFEFNLFVNEYEEWWSLFFATLFLIFAIDHFIEWNVGMLLFCLAVFIFHITMSARAFSRKRKAKNYRN